MRLIIIFFLFFSISINAQEKGDVLIYDNFVESYYNKKNEQPILVYNKINGRVVDTLYNIDDKYAWYKLAISDSDSGWLKIKNIQRLPSEYKNYGYENHWVKSSDFLINVDVYNPNKPVYLFELPSIKSNRIHKIDEHQSVNVTEIDGLWAKVKFTIDNKIIEGWLSFKNQCGLPWTSCPKYD